MQLPVTYNFRLTLKGPKDAASFAGAFPPIDMSFHSISGLAGFIDRGIADIKDATKISGQGVTYGTLVLRRAVVHIDDSLLSQWVFSWLYKQSAITLEEGYVELLDDRQQPYMRWKLTGITPKGWKLDELDGQKNEVLFETIELGYTSLVFVSNKPQQPPKPPGK